MVCADKVGEKMSEIRPEKCIDCDYYVARLRQRHPNIIAVNLTDTR